MGGISGRTHAGVCMLTHPALVTRAATASFSQLLLPACCLLLVCNAASRKHTLTADTHGVQGSLQLIGSGSLYTTACMMPAPHAAAVHTIPSNPNSWCAACVAQIFWGPVHGSGQWRR